jgi:hypothetical protein
MYEYLSLYYIFNNFFGQTVFSKSRCIMARNCIIIAPTVTLAFLGRVLGPLALSKSTTAPRSPLFSLSSAVLTALLLR